MKRLRQILSIALIALTSIGFVAPDMGAQTRKAKTTKTRTASANKPGAIAKFTYDRKVIFLMPNGVVKSSSPRIEGSYTKYTANDDGSQSPYYVLSISDTYSDGTHDFLIDGGKAYNYYDGSECEFEVREYDSASKRIYIYDSCTGDSRWIYLRNSDSYAVTWLNK